MSQPLRWIAVWALGAVAAGLPARAFGDAGPPAGAGPPAARESAGATALVDTIARVQPKVVKIYGAGGYRGMEAYQSGILISPQGHVLTAWSYVLDTEEIGVTLSDGRKLQGKLLGADPRLEIAVLKIEAAGVPWFELSKAPAVEPGTRVLALSNLFGVAVGSEPVSVQHGTIAAKTRLAARRGVFETPYRGTVYVLDAVTNNPGAAGGALVTRRGELVALLGKEVRNTLNNTWLNYAVPIAELRESVEQIRAGKLATLRPDEPAGKVARPHSIEGFGIVLVPDVVERTPPFVDRVVEGSPAAAAGILPDDLVVLVGEHLVPSCKALREELQHIDADEKVKLTVLRAEEMLEFVLQASLSDRKTL